MKWCQFHRTPSGDQTIDLHLPIQIDAQYSQHIHEHGRIHDTSATSCVMKSLYLNKVVSSRGWLTTRKCRAMSMFSGAIFAVFIAIAEICSV